MRASRLESESGRYSTRPRRSVQAGYACGRGSEGGPRWAGGNAMLINFFFTLRAARLKVSVKEYLMLLEAIQPA